MHASVPSQLTRTAEIALDEISMAPHEMFGAPGIFAEFPSALRRLVNRPAMAAQRAEAILTWFLDLDIEPVTPTRALQERAWAIATRLGQSDTFDAMGYAVAEAVDGEFWTSDQRFVRAATSAGLTRLRLVP